jgi:hypothetical protein
MNNLIPAVWAYVILEAIRFGYTVGWDIYLNLGK